MQHWNWTLSPTILKGRTGKRWTPTKLFVNEEWLGDGEIYSKGRYTIIISQRKFQIMKLPLQNRMIKYINAAF